MIPTDSTPFSQNSATKTLLMSYKFEQLPELYHDGEEPEVPEEEPDHPEDPPIQVPNSAKRQLPEEVSLLGDTEFNEDVEKGKKSFNFNAW
uniref:AGC-kinase C-terminal domain-containing protein n=1 Tax=Panagrellus redivivus TaxID=6233 RepID=A0A7E4W6C9_PANRE